MKGHGQIMALLNGWNKNIGKLMAGTGNRGFAADGRSREKNSGFTGYENFQPENNSQSIATPAKQKTKNCEELNL